MLGGHEAKPSVNVSSVDGGKGLFTDNRLYNFSMLYSQPEEERKSCKTYNNSPGPANRLSLGYKPQAVSTS